MTKLLRIIVVIEFIILLIVSLLFFLKIIDADVFKTMMHIFVVSILAYTFILAVLNESKKNKVYKDSPELTKEQLDFIFDENREDEIKELYKNFSPEELNKALHRSKRIQGSFEEIDNSEISDESLNISPIVEDKKDTFDEIIK